MAFLSPSSLLRRLVAGALVGAAALLAGGCATRGGGDDAAAAYGRSGSVEVFGTIDAGVSNHGRSGIR